MIHFNSMAQIVVQIFRFYSNGNVNRFLDHYLGTLFLIHFVSILYGKKVKFRISRRSDSKKYRNECDIFDREPFA